MPEITRIHRGEKKEFEVEVVCAKNGDLLPGDPHPFDEILVVAQGTISIDRSDCDEAELHVATDTIEIPAGVAHPIRIHETPTRLVIIHPDRLG